MGKDKRLKEEKELSKVQEAQKLLMGEQQKKIQACSKEIKEVLKKHGFRSEERRVGKECRSRWSP